MLPELAAGVRALRRRTYVRHWIELGTTHLQVTLVALGAVVLYLRALEHWDTRASAALLPWSAVALLSAAWLARRRQPSPAWAATWLDVHGGALGAVVTEDELGHSPWSSRAREQVSAALAHLPRPDLGRAGRALLLPTLFAGLAAWIPIPERPVGPPPIVATAQVEALAEKLVALEETLELPPEQRSELEKRLEQIRAEAEQGETASTFEAIDRLESELEDQAARALETARHSAEDLARAGGSPDLAEAQEALESALAGLEQAGLGKDLPPEVRTALAPGSLQLPEGVQLDSRELARLSQELRGVLDRNLGKLAAGKLIDAAQLRAARAAQARLGEAFGEPDPAHECDESCKQPGGT